MKLCVCVWLKSVAHLVLTSEKVFKHITTEPSTSTVNIYSNKTNERSNTAIKGLEMEIGIKADHLYRVYTLPSIGDIVKSTCMMHGLKLQASNFLHDSNRNILSFSVHYIVSIQHQQEKNFDPI